MSVSRLGIEVPRKACFLSLFFICLMACQSQEPKRKEVSSVSKEDSLKQSAYHSRDSTRDMRLHLIEAINKNLRNRIDVKQFLDSLTRQDKIIVLDRCQSFFDSKKNMILYKSNNYEFSLEIKKNNTGYSGAKHLVFYDGDYKIDFTDYEVLSFNNETYRSENFGFQYKNGLSDLKTIEVAGKKFIYANIAFTCMGNGCGCAPNFIYDLENHKAFFIENYRFPYDGFFISDFDNNGVVDLLVIGRGTKEINGLPLYEFSYQLTWFEYIDNEFKVKYLPNFSNKVPYSFELISYSTNTHFPHTDFSLIRP